MLTSYLRLQAKQRTENPGTSMRMRWVVVGGLTVLVIGTTVLSEFRRRRRRNTDQSGNIAQGVAGNIVPTNGGRQDEDQEPQAAAAPARPAGEEGNNQVDEEDEDELPVNQQDVDIPVQFHPVAEDAEENEPREAPVEVAAGDAVPDDGTSDGEAEEADEEGADEGLAMFAMAVQQDRAGEEGAVEAHAEEGAAALADQQTPPAAEAQAEEAEEVAALADQQDEPAAEAQAEEAEEVAALADQQDEPAAEAQAEEAEEVAALADQQDEPAAEAQAEEAQEVAALADQQDEPAAEAQAEEAQEVAALADQQDEPAAEAQAEEAEEVAALADQQDEPAAEAQAEEAQEVAALADQQDEPAAEAQAEEAEEVAALADQQDEPAAEAQAEEAEEVAALANQQDEPAAEAQAEEAEEVAALANQQDEPAAEAQAEEAESAIAIKDCKTEADSDLSAGPNEVGTPTSVQGIAAIANTSQSDDSEQQEATTPVSTAEPLQSVEREQALPEGMSGALEVTNGIFMGTISAAREAYPLGRQTSTLVITCRGEVSPCECEQVVIPERGCIDDKVWLAWAHIYISRVTGWVSGGGKVLVVSSPSSLKLVLAGLICDGLPFSAAVDKLVPQLMRMNIDRQDDFFLQIHQLRRELASPTLVRKFVMRCCPSTETMLAIRQDNAAFLEDTCILEQCGKAQTIVMGARSTAECRESARIWAEIFSEQEGKYAASFEVHGKEKRQVAANVHKGRGSTAQLDDEASRKAGRPLYHLVSKQEQYGCHAIFPIHALQGVCFGDEAAATDKDFLASQGFMLVISSQAVAMPEGSSVKQLSNLAERNNEGMWLSILHDFNQHIKMETKVAGGKVLIVIDECTYRLAFAALTCAGHRHSHIEKMLKPLHFVLKLQFTVNSALGKYMAELRDDDTLRRFVMTQHGSSWIPVRQDGVQCSAQTVVLQHHGKQQTICKGLQSSPAALKAAWAWSKLFADHEAKHDAKLDKIQPRHSEGARVQHIPQPRATPQPQSRPQPQAREPRPQPQSRPQLQKARANEGSKIAAAPLSMQAPRPQVNLGTYMGAAIQSTLNQAAKDSSTHPRPSTKKQQSSRRRR